MGRFRELDEMGRITRQMLADALDALIRGDAAAARAVRERDDQWTRSWTPSSASSSPT
jgi:phosphate uptake regulator